jgi:hypothetical protein
MKNYRLHLIIALLTLSFSLVLLSGPAQAYVYDDFTGSGIDTSLWVDVGPNTGLFPQPGDGYLYFNDSSGGHTDRLRSYNPVSGAFLVSMQYFDFQTINDQPPNVGKSSAMRLRLESGNNNVGVEEGKNIGGLFFDGQANRDGIRTSLHAVSAGNTNSGWLGMYYNGILGAGGVVDLWYDSGAGWTLLDSWAPNFSGAPYFSIYGLDQYGSSLSFRVAQVQLTPIPLPSSILLIGSGLLGLTGLRRFRKL